MILGHSEIERRLLEFFPMQRPYKIGAASADVRVGNTMQLENGLDYIAFSTATEENPYVLSPGQRVLVDMLEEVHLPTDISALFTLKSTRGREGYNHAVAGWVDPGWKGKLTMELKNDNQYKPLDLYPGLPIGQLIFMQTIDGGEYKGRYQGSTEVSGAREEIDYHA
jgi:dCTP deaminase